MIFEVAMFVILSARVYPSNTKGRCAKGTISIGREPELGRFVETPEAYRFLGQGKSAPNLKQIRAGLSFAYRHWDLKNPFSKIDPPIHKEPQIRYLLPAPRLP
jgi:hypothetical protein